MQGLPQHRARWTGPSTTSRRRNCFLRRNAAATHSILDVPARRIARRRKFERETAGEGDDQHDQRRRDDDDQRDQRDHRHDEFEANRLQGVFCHPSVRLRHSRGTSGQHAEHGDHGENREKKDDRDRGGERPVLQRRSLLIQIHRHEQHLSAADQRLGNEGGNGCGIGQCAAGDDAGQRQRQHHAPESAPATGAERAGGILQVMSIRPSAVMSGSVISGICTWASARTTPTWV